MRIKIYSLALLATAILSACSNQDEESNDNKQAQLQLNVKGCLTRSVITATSLSEDSQLGVFVADQDNSISATNVEGIVKGDYCLLQSTVTLGDEPAYVYAYYPYSSNYTDPSSIAYYTASQTDYLMGYSDDGTGKLDYVDSSRPTANMLLTHAMARVTLNIKKSASNGSTALLTRVSLNGVATEGTINLLEHTSKGSTLGTVATSTSTTLSSSEETAFDLLVAPTTSLTDATLNLTIDGTLYTAAIPTTNAKEWVAGRQYSYAVEVGEETNIKVSDASITLWNNNQQDEINITRALEVTTTIEGTRSVVTGSTFADGDEIGLFAYDDNGEPYDSLNVCTNVKTTLSSSIWQSSPKIILSSAKANVYGYYPYDADATIKGDSVKISMAPDWKIGQKDYMYSARAEADSLNNHVNLAFKHALARITLAIKKSSTDNGNGNITAVELSNGVSSGSKGTEIAETGWMKLGSGEIERIENSESKITINLDEQAKAGETLNIEILVIPNQSAAQSARSASPVVFTLTIDDTTHSFTINNPQWYAGEQYTYPINLSRS